jgi:hypothetical protein
VLVVQLGDVSVWEFGLEVCELFWLQAFCGNLEFLTDNLPHLVQLASLLVKYLLIGRFSCRLESAHASGDVPGLQHGG